VAAAVVSGVRRLLPLAALLCACAALAPAAGALPLDRSVAVRLAAAGGASGGYVLDLTTNLPLAAVRPDTTRNPASVEKLYTTSTALLRLGPQATLTTSVLGAGALDPDGSWRGSLYLRGGGDPTLDEAGIAGIAAALRGTGIRRVAGPIYGDETLLDGLRGGPASGYGEDLIDLGGQLGGLLVDRGLSRGGLQPRPAAFAAQRLAVALRHAGVRVNVRRVGARPAPAGTQQLATLASPPLATLVADTLAPSDNLFAELLLKDIGARLGAGGTTAAGVAVVRRTVARFHVHPILADGSGLSRADRTSPRQVVLLLAGMRRVGALRAGLPVAGRTGTLAHRMRGSSAQDRCQAKTGTLSDVSALAGYCLARNGHLLAFAFMENHVFTPRAKEMEDRLAILLARQRPAGGAAPPPPPPTDGGGAGSP